MNGWANKQTWIAVNYGMADLSVDDLRHIIDNDDLSEYRKIDAIAAELRDNFLSYAEDNYQKITSGGDCVSELLLYICNTIDWTELASVWYRDNQDQF
jgi:hypothetical protein